MYVNMVRVRTTPRANASHVIRRCAAARLLAEAQSALCAELDEPAIGGDGGGGRLGADRVAPLIAEIDRAERCILVCARARDVSAALRSCRRGAGVESDSNSDLAGDDDEMRALLALDDPEAWPRGARDAAHDLGLFDKYNGRVASALDRGCTVEEAVRAQRVGVVHELIVRFGVFCAVGASFARVAEAENYGGGHAVEHGVGARHAVFDDTRGALDAGRVFIYAYKDNAAGLVVSLGRPVDRLGSPCTLLLRGVTIGDGE